MIRQLLATALLIGVGGTAHAQTAPQLPPPEKTDPVALQLMQGFPPPPDKVVTLGTVLSAAERALGLSASPRTRTDGRGVARRRWAERC